MPSGMVTVLLVVHAAYAAPLSMTQDEVDECQGWLKGTRDTYVDQELQAGRKKNHSIRHGFTSQSRQDKQMWLALFKQQHEQQQLRRQQSDGAAAQHERPFTYADVAANHFKRISNTYFYDRCLGWRGLCVEPNPRCASNHTKAIDFVFPNAAPGASGAMGDWAGAFGKIKGAAKALRDDSSGEVTRLHCVRLGDELLRRGWAHVDLLSLDVEGHELETLLGVDFTRVHIDFILSENPQVEVLLRPLGYEPSRLKFGGGDVLWARPGHAAAVLQAAIARGIKLH